MSYRVELTTHAERDVDGILAWLTQRSSQGATAWYRRFNDLLEELALAAEQWSLAPENEDNDEVIRHAVFKTRRGRKYRALFIIREEVVFILHVRGPGQDIMPLEEVQFP
jgi:plasmid stabilization system protein ParE